MCVSGVWNVRNVLRKKVNSGASDLVVQGYTITRSDTDIEHGLATVQGPWWQRKRSGSWAKATIFIYWCRERFLFCCSYEYECFFSRRTTKHVDCSTSMERTSQNLSKPTWPSDGLALYSVALDLDSKKHSPHFCQHAQCIQNFTEPGKHLLHNHVQCIWLSPIYLHTYWFPHFDGSLRASAVGQGAERQPQLFI